MTNTDILKSIALQLPQWNATAPDSALLVIGVSLGKIAMASLQGPCNLIAATTCAMMDRDPGLRDMILLIADNYRSRKAEQQEGGKK